MEVTPLQKQALDTLTEWGFVTDTSVRVYRGNDTRVFMPSILRRNSHAVNHYGPVRTVEVLVGVGKTDLIVLYPVAPDRELPTDHPDMVRLYRRARKYQAVLMVSAGDLCFQWSILSNAQTLTGQPNRDLAGALQSAMRDEIALSILLEDSRRYREVRKLRQQITDGLTMLRDTPKTDLDTDQVARALTGCTAEVTSDGRVVRYLPDSADYRGFIRWRTVPGTP